MLRILVGGAAIVITSAAFPGVAGIDLVAQSGVGNTRSMQSGRWAEVAHFDPEGELFDNPRLVTSSGGLLYILDYGDRTIKAVDRTGRVQWRAGGQGSGPGELENPTSMQAGPDGNLWVNDPANGRIGRYSSSGRPIGQITVTDQLIQVLPLEGREFVGLGNMANALVQVYDSTGRVRSRVPLPDSLANVDLITRQALLAGDRGRLAVVFRFSSLLYLVQLAGGQVSRFNGPEPVGFPAPLRVSTKINGQTARITRANPNAVAAARGAFLDATGTLWVLFGGAGPHADRVLDGFDLRTGQYLGSREIPRRVVAITSWGADVVGVVEDPVPSVYVWRWTPAGRTRGQ